MSPNELARASSAGDGGIRERKKRETRARIIQAGIELFAERGYRETTVEDIAAAADISPSTFFLYFDRKDELLFEEQREGARELQALLESRPLGVSTLEVIGKAYVDQPAPSPDVLRLRRLRYKVVQAEKRLQVPDRAEFADAIRLPLIDAYATDFRYHGHPDPTTSAVLLTGLTIGGYMELIHLIRDSVSRGTRHEDDQQIRLASAAMIDALRAGFESMLFTV